MRFAEEELSRYMKKVTGSSKHGIIIQVISPEDRYGDDGYKIDVVSGKGIIEGNNNRSVLLGVYAFFRKLGCRFFIAGEVGEHIVSLPLSACSVRFSHRYELKYRGLVIEGSVSKENVIGMIDWAAKNGMNGYFLQFENSFEFFERWYKHENNPYKKSEPFSWEKADEFCAEIISELKKRGMDYHAVGHGWMCKVLRIQPKGWYTEDESSLLSEEEKNYLAEVNGRRGFYGGIPLNTNLCYSDPTVRKKIAESVLKYAEEHLEIDHLHVWLADGFNNFCECKKCAVSTPSDLYIKLLNEIDEMLTARGIETKIVFLIYFDLLLPPKTERIKNENRFVMMFAPATRGYRESFKTEIAASPCFAPENYKVNTENFGEGINKNVAWLKGWKTVFGGAAFDFDYHLMWEGYNEITGVRLSKILFDDIQSLKAIGLDGFMSCQVQRNFFPTGFTMHVMARCCEDPSIDFQVLKEEYFTSEFGKHGGEIYDYLLSLSEPELVDFLSARYVSENALRECVLKVREKAEKTLPFLKEASRGNAPYIQYAHAYRKLVVFSEFYVKMCNLILQKINGASAEKLESEIDNFEKWIYRFEDEFINELDCMYYVIRMKNIIECEAGKIAR